ncbi:hypothetical protein AKJ41_03520 [candidate division MSBL1 archaeon SCGC-AAA259O05]|uniref:Uncharacterized protein n=1 Tax=candidate division MSBL1 archaeon SCGC-AAA259O05 TaxID=1698271 RepID=A0A133V381_9EURY|nr:hypothetical protein AKJ41_03520 [candidate division MSBL1 archaeon SCGC-AAA259O05]
MSFRPSLTSLNCSVRSSSSSSSSALCSSMSSRSISLLTHAYLSDNSLGSWVTPSTSSLWV